MNFYHKTITWLTKTKSQRYVNKLIKESLIVKSLVPICSFSNSGHLIHVLKIKSFLCMVLLYCFDVRVTKKSFQRR